MALSANFFGDIGGAVSDIFGGIGALKEADAYKKASEISLTNAAITKRSTAINLAQAGRQLYQSFGAESADTASAGFQMSGSAIDLMRSSVQQGSLTQQIISNQGAITEQGFQQQAASYQGQAAAAKAKSSGGFLSGVLGLAGAAASLFSDRRLKENIAVVSKLPLGINLYSFNYKGQRGSWFGVMADEVEEIMPEAVTYSNDGYAMVNYQMLGIEMKRVN